MLGACPFQGEIITLGAWGSRSPLFLAISAQDRSSVMLSLEGEGDRKGSGCDSRAADSHYFFVFVDFQIYKSTISVNFHEEEVFLDLL